MSNIPRKMLHEFTPRSIIQAPSGSRNRCGIIGEAPATCTVCSSGRVRGSAHVRAVPAFCAHRHSVPAYRRRGRHPLDQGLPRLFARSRLQRHRPCGTNGEAPSLSVDERRLVVEATVIAADGMPVIAGTGAAALPDAIRVDPARLLGGRRRRAGHAAVLLPASTQRRGHDVVSAPF